jgi:hypothetical protein
VLPDVAEGAEEVIPVKHCSQVILRALVAGSRSRNHVTNNFRVSTFISPAISPTDWAPKGNGCHRSHCRVTHERQPPSIPCVTISGLVADLSREFDADRMLLLFSTRSGGPPRVPPWQAQPALGACRRWHPFVGSRENMPSRVARALDRETRHFSIAYP